MPAAPIAKGQTFSLPRASKLSFIRLWIHYLTGFTGIIIAASIIVAAGIAFYENEAIRQWIDTYRQKIAVALHSLGDEINPPSQNMEEDEEAQRRRRQSIIRRNQLELVRRAREEGVAVDLDELAAIARDYDAQNPEARRSPSRTFDDLVGSDGMLRARDITAASTTATAAIEEDGLRHRGAGARGFSSGSPLANPFDDAAAALFDEELIGLHDNEVWSQPDTLQSRESTRTLSAEPLIDVSNNTAQSPYKTDDELNAEIAEAIRRSLEDVTTTAMVVDDTPPAPLSASQEMVEAPPDPPTSVPGSIYESYYYGPHPSNLQQSLSLASGSFHSATAQQLQPLTIIPPQIADEQEDNNALTPAGAMTPTEDGFSTAASLAGSGADVGVISEIESMADDHDIHDQQSEAGFSEAYSVIGTSTPGSWTDVESVDGEEEHGQVHLG